MPEQAQTREHIQVQSQGLLRIENLNAWYGESHSLHRTTALKSILGLVDRCTGAIPVAGTDIIKQPTHPVARIDMLRYSPEERGIFSRLNMDENLSLPPRLSGGMSVDEIFRMFPNLDERRRSRGSQLSGGKQHVLVMGRVLRTAARLLLLDDIKEGSPR